MGANDIQIGGTHYKGTDLQVWDLGRYGVGFLEGSAVKYITRWRKKNGREDIEKALHYIEKIKEEYRVNGYRNPARNVSQDWELGQLSARFIQANQIEDDDEQVAITALICWSRMQDIYTAEDAVNALLRKCQ